MFSNLPDDIFNHQISLYLSLDDLLNLQYALPRCKILTATKQTYLKFRSCSQENKKFKHTKFHLNFVEAFKKNFQYEEIPEYLKNKNLYPLIEKNPDRQLVNRYSTTYYTIPTEEPVIYTHIKIISSDNQKYLIKLCSNNYVSYTFSSVWGEKECDIFIPVCKGTNFSVCIIGKCKVVLSNYKTRFEMYLNPPLCDDWDEIPIVYKQKIPKIFTLISTNVSTGEIAHYYHFVCKESFENVILCGKKFNINELQILWNICKQDVRRPNEFILPANISFQDKNDIVYDFESILSSIRIENTFVLHMKKISYNIICSFDNTPRALFSRKFYF